MRHGRLSLTAKAKILLLLLLQQIKENKFYIIGLQRADMAQNQCVTTIESGGMIMKAFVNDACIGCGLCASLCPEVFHMTDAGLAEATSDDIDADLQDTAIEARDSCPVNAIDITE